MKSIELLKAQIEAERSVLDKMLETMNLEEVLEQNRKLDHLMEEYIHMTNV